MALNQMIPEYRNFLEGRGIDIERYRLGTLSDQVALVTAFETQASGNPYSYHGIPPVFHRQVVSTAYFRCLSPFRTIINLTAFLSLFFFLS